MATRRHADDNLTGLTDLVVQCLAEADAVVLTGGVSKGAYDYVPAAVAAAGGEVVFHRISARPGQPTLGAVVGGRAVIGLPGNPLAVLTAGRRVLLPVLRRLAGFEDIDPPAPKVIVSAWRGSPIPIAYWRPVNLVAPGVAEITSLTGSGDVCGPAMSDGFIEAPPDQSSGGEFPYYPWRP
jgi:molybdopterin molybdotransferase